MISQGGQRPGVGGPVGQRFEQPPGAHAEEVRDQARELEGGLFQQRLQPVLELDPGARQLDLRAGHRPPQALLGRGYEAQDQLLGDQPLHQPFGVREVALAPPSRAVRSRVRQVQGAGHRAGPGPRPGARRPVPFPRGPDGLPVRRRRFHDDFVDLVLAPPVGQPAQLRGRAPELAPRERVLPVGGEIGDDHGQHPFVPVNAGARVGPGGRSFWRERRACLQVPYAGSQAINAPRGDRDAHLFAQPARSGSARSTAWTAPVSARPCRSRPRRS
jgi:hypothetical protein